MRPVDGDPGGQVFEHRDNKFGLPAPKRRLDVPAVGPNDVIMPVLGLGVFDLDKVLARAFGDLDLAFGVTVVWVAAEPAASLVVWGAEPHDVPRVERVLHRGEI